MTTESGETKSCPQFVIGGFLLFPIKTNSKTGSSTFRNFKPNIGGVQKKKKGNIKTQLKISYQFVFYCDDALIQQNIMIILEGELKALTRTRLL